MDIENGYISYIYPKFTFFSALYVQKLSWIIMILEKFLAATKQFYEWFSSSVPLSVCPSACHTFLIMVSSSYHQQIFRSYYPWKRWCPCKRSKSEVKGQGDWGQNTT